MSVYLNVSVSIEIDSVPCKVADCAQSQRHLLIRAWRSSVEGK